MLSGKNYKLYDQKKYKCIVLKIHIIQRQNYTCQTKTSRNKPYCSLKWKSGKCDVRIYRTKMNFCIKNMKCEMTQTWSEYYLLFFQLSLKK